VALDGEMRTRAARTHFEDNVVVDGATSAPPAASTAGVDRRPLPVALLAGMRPRQWLKNVLVFAAPLASGTVLTPAVLVPTLLAFGLFCLIASGVYLVNDVRDREADRQHPTKRFRPVAAGELPVPLAVAAGAVLIVGPLLAAPFLTRPALAGVLGAYVAISLAYSFFLKDQPVIDLAAVASGFLLRGVAGGVAAGIPLSRWFLLVAAFGALFMVAGKRYAEIVALGEAAETRRSLREYSASYLRFVWTLSAGVACTAYSLWAFEMQGSASGFPWQTVSIAPFVLGLLRYAVDVDRGAAGAPEDIVLGDRALLALGAIWAVVFVLGVWLP
jgi:decaprenyl-phosphate phosphoribosyltransferase